jgi:hypothetical protein
MRRADPSQAAREVDSAASSFVAVRILHYASAAPTTAAAISERLCQHGGPASPNRIFARMTRAGLLRPAPASIGETQRTRKYLLTLKGRRLLDTARNHLRQLAAP